VYETILYPTDGSEASLAAVEHARGQAEQHGAAVQVLYVVDTEQAGVGLASDLDLEPGGGMIGSPSGGGTGMVGTRDGGGGVSDRLESRGTDVVERVAEQFDGIETHTAVRTGTPHETILEYADEVGADMVVMSTHGRSGIDRFLIGSVTEKVVRLADVPILTVRAAES